MKLLFCGDVVGKAGRKIVHNTIEVLRQQFDIDIVITNGENAAHGFGITPRIFDEFIKHGTDVVTLGNHSFDKADIFPVLTESDRIVRPLNLPENTIGKGWCVFTTSSGVRVAVVQLLGRVYMRAAEDPFSAIEKWLNTHHKGVDYDVLFVDFHAEATAEKVAMGHFLDGRASVVIGTHTHIPTADHHILPHQTAYMTDVGMCGDYDSVIGMQKESALSRFFSPDRKGRLQPAEINSTFCGVCVDIDEKTGHAVQIFPVRIGNALENTHKI